MATPSDDSPAQRDRWSRRIAVLVFAAILFGGWSAWLAQPDTPGRSSTEAGYVAALGIHARQTTGALDLLLDLVDDGPIVDTIRAARESHARIADDADRTLRQWGVADPPSDPVAWMGHVLPGQIPGSLDLDTLAALDDRALLAESTGDLVLAADGAMLMARAGRDLSDHDAVEALTSTGLAADDTLRDALQQLRVQRRLAPAVAVPAMTTDPGELDHGGDPVDSLGQALSGALRVGPLLLAAALALLAIAAPARPDPQRGRLAVAGLASAAAGVLHGGLIAAHFDEAAASGIFFVVVAVTQTALGALLLAGRPTLGAAAAANAAVICIYAIFRLVPAPGTVGPATIDLTGLVTLALQLTVVAVWVFDTTDLAPALARIHAETSDDRGNSADRNTSGQ